MIATMHYIFHEVFQWKPVLHVAWTDHSIKFTSHSVKSDSLPAAGNFTKNEESILIRKNIEVEMMGIILFPCTNMPYRGLVQGILRRNIHQRCATQRFLKYHSFTY
jgi:hypothetical protein